MKKIIIIGMALLSIAFYCNDAPATMMQVIASGGGESGGGGGGGGDTELFSDNFNDNEGGGAPTGWTLAAGLATIEQNGRLELTENDNSNIIYYSTTTGSIQHYAQATLVVVNAEEMGFILRHPGSNAPFYWIGITSTITDFCYYSNNTTWVGCSTNTPSLNTSRAVSDVFKARIEGTGTSTKVYLYQNDVLVDKGNGTTFDFSDADDRPNGTTYADTGTYVGLARYSPNTNLGAYDDFSGGTWE